MSRFQYVLFDLDGTLIDSAPAILASYRQAFAATGRAPAVTIDESIVGPPLIETLHILAGTKDPQVIDELAGHFKASYDTTGYRETAAYEGVAEMLRRLAGSGRTLAIATNKRLHPTRLILDHLGWSGYFKTVYALDLFEPRLPSKAAMIARLMADHDIPEHVSVYVGDRSEDGESADANRLPFFAATWGYGSLVPEEMATHWRAFASPAALTEALLND
ncbi:phosphoglycolate phosphatase [Aromatoleum tolulyticum]|uniref:Phosphoglycolate phosphatase n=1 Tax=Aromatoleum tolulyticum TaxID=34027 RepID=A0A1N6U544_9RHOO|nr:HAD family hydrolase [Aromatoleum tolulyticum]SIQ60768.1 phosphoglycolate phosphatase [Aromatoleum tolulyticum]